MIKISLIILLVTFVCSLPLDSGIFKQNTSPEYGDHFEGDMILTKEQENALKSPARNGLIDTKYRWPNKTVPYDLSTEFSEEQADFIQKAFRTLESVSCVKFIKYTNEENILSITGQNAGCWSFVGYQNHSQQLNLNREPLGTGCFRFGTILHELLHTLGFYHMQNAYDRDDFVTIHWENMLPGTEKNYAKNNNSEVTHFNTTYDYLSVMHYGAYVYSTNGQPVIMPIDEDYLKKIGQREKLSEIDILKLNRMYDCEDNL